MEEIPTNDKDSNMGVIKRKVILSPTIAHRIPNGAEKTLKNIASNQTLCRSCRRVAPILESCPNILVRWARVMENVPFNNMAKHSIKNIFKICATAATS